MYLVLCVSIFAYLLRFYLLSVLGATTASSYHFMMPPLGLLFGWLMLGEHFELNDVLGIVPIAIGIYLYSYALRIRKSAGLMTRKLSVTESQKAAQFFGTSWRKKCRTDRQKSL